MKRLGKSTFYFAQELRQGGDVVVPRVHFEQGKQVYFTVSYSGSQS